MTLEREKAFSAIRDAIATGIKNFLAGFKHDWANETMYGFLLEAVWEGTSVEVVAATEEGLLRIAKIELVMFVGKKQKHQVYLLTQKSIVSSRRTNS